MSTKKKPATTPSAPSKSPKRKARATVGYLPGGRVIFAFALTPAERSEIHRAAGPGKASAFVLQAALAAAKKAKS